MKKVSRDSSLAFCNAGYCLILLGIIYLQLNTTFAQSTVYTVANVHSHNDYQQVKPFTTAYQHQLGSMEADIFLWNDSLIVGHEFRDIQLRRTLQAMYLDSLAYYFSKNGNTPYKDTSRSLILLIDIKTGAAPTLHRLIEVLQGYPQLIHSGKLQIIITGNRPAPDQFKTYPDFIFFDGNIQDDYTTVALHKIGLMSDDFRKYSVWNGTGVIPVADSVKLAFYITKMHALQKKIRFWAAPDIENAWRQLMGLQVDYLNTDHIEQISGYLSKNNK